MKPQRALKRQILWIAAAVLGVGGAIAYGATALFRFDAISPHIGLQGGAAVLTARVLTTPVGETTGGWHYHPGYVYNVVTQGTITIEEQNRAEWRARMRADANDRRLGGGIRARMILALEPDDAGTRLRIDTELAVLGKIGEFGRA